jgi:cytochrome b561
MIPIQFYLAGHGAMEAAYSVEKPAPLMKTAWDPHVAFGTIMALIAILILLTGLAARPTRQLTWMSIGLFLAMLVQFILPFFAETSPGRAIAALHAVNALVVTGLAIMLVIRARAYLPFTSRANATGRDTVPTAS